MFFSRVDRGLVRCGEAPALPLEMTEAKKAAAKPRRPARIFVGGWLTSGYRCCRSPSPGPPQTKAKPSDRPPDDYGNSQLLVVGEPAADAVQFRVAEVADVH